MIETLYNLPFHILVPPNIKVRRFGIPMPSAMTVFSVVLLSYFLVTGGECKTICRRRLTRYLSTYIYILQASFTMSLWSRLVWAPLWTSTATHVPLLSCRTV